MRWLLYVFVAVWALGIFAGIVRGWYFQMLNNREPGKKANSFFDSSCYNPTGKEAHRQMIRLWVTTVAWSLGGMALWGIVQSLMS